VPKVSAEHREARREEILCAARRRFASEGFHATSMQDILTESGLSAGAVYRYFDSKSDIVSAIACENMSNLLDSLESYADSAADLPVADAVVAVLQRIRAKHEGDSLARLALQVWAESARDPALRARFCDTHQRFRAIVRTLVQRRHPDLGTEADAVAGAITAIVPGFLHQLALLDPEATKDFEAGVRRMLDGF
jgi:TetR/AcrR family transcriptional regulator, transcriptional repressor of aconitase